MSRYNTIFGRYATDDGGTLCEGIASSSNGAT
jgi:hypothetical protein